MIKEPIMPNIQISEGQNSLAETLDLKRKSFEEIYHRDEANIDKMIGITNKTKQKTAINSHINLILEDFNNSQKTKEDFDQMMKRLLAMEMNGAVYQKEVDEEREKQVGEYLYNKDRAWSQEQVDEIIDYFEEFELDEIPREGFNRYSGHYFWEMFTTSQKKEKEQTTISDLVANHLAKRIERGGRLPEALQEEVRAWCQNIQMIDSDVRLDFLSSVLNNPGKVSGHTTGEAIGHMGLYGPGFIRQLEENLEKSGKNIGKALKVITILNHLRHKRDQAGFGDSGDEALKILYETRDEADNYFIKAKASQVLREPLEDYTVKEKRAFLKGDWRNIMQPDNFYDTIQPVLGESDPYEAMHIDPMDETMLLDQEVDAIFDKYRYIESAYYYWNERIQIQDRYEDEDLRINYNIIPQTAEQEYYKEKIIRESCYTRINNKYGVIYTSGGQVDSFFELNPEIETQSSEDRDKNGDITEYSLKFFVDKFERALEREDTEQFLYYLQIRNSLPSEFKDRIDDRLGLNIPKELDRDFATKEEFNNKLEKHKESLLKNLSEFSVEKTGFLTDELKRLLKQRKDAAKEKYFGFASENIELLDFFNSFNMQHPNSVQPTAHHTICYYLYLRKNLPENLTSEFEEKFDVKVPNNLKEFGTFDEYLATSDRELLMPFTHYQNFHEMSTWLNQNIGNLSQKIKETKDTPERLSISEILEKEGFKKDNMSEEEYEKLLMTYKTLIELPIRERIEKDFGIKLEDYSVREQVQFVNFLSTKTIEDVDRVKEFLGNGGEKDSVLNRIKSFLSLEQDPGMGERILEIGEKLDQKSADVVFSRYSEIIKMTNDVEGELMAYYKGENINEKDIKNASEQLLIRAKNLLSDFADKVKKDGKVEPEEVLRILDDYKTDLILTISIYKTLSQDKNISPESLKGVDYQEVLAGDFFEDKEIVTGIEQEFMDRYDQRFTSGCPKFDNASETDQKRAEEFWEMLNIYKKNWESHPERGRIFIQGFIQKFKEKDSRSTLHQYKHNGRPAAFLRIDDTEDGNKYFGSFNALSTMKGNAFGTALLKKVMSGIDPEKSVSAVVVGQERVLGNYVNKFGFTMNGVDLDYASSGKPMVKIHRPPEAAKKSYYYRDYTDEDIIKEYEQNLGNHNGEKYFIARFDLSLENENKMAAEIKKITESDYISTKIVFDRKNNKVYYAFEAS